MSLSPCFHCGLPVDANDNFTVLIGGAPRVMCCIGCQAVASAIVDGGLEKFYQYRVGLSESSSGSGSSSASSAEDWSIYDLSEIQDDLITVDEQGLALVDLGVSGITCTACAWLIEHHLNKLPGIEQASVNVSRQRCRIRWSLEKSPLSQVLASFTDIGYRAHPVSDSNRLEHIDRDQRAYLLRLGVAGIGMMQAGMLAIGLYAGAFQGMEARWEELLRWVSLVVATPVVLYAAQPFFAGARRSLTSLHLTTPSRLHLTMDVPVALAIGLAYSASAWATATGTGEVYFDAVSMLTFFLLLGRFLEMRVRYHNELVAGGAAQLIPPTAMRWNSRGDSALAITRGAKSAKTSEKILEKVSEKLQGKVLERVPVKSLSIGDVIEIGEGERLPIDGVVLTGESRVVEAILTGEQDPLAKGPGDVVSAGTLNTTNRLQITVSAVGNNTRLANILKLLDGAVAEKPRQVEVADRLASWFVALVLVLAGVVFGTWYLHDGERALWVTLSVLVVTCPCALSLATPVALTAATGQLQRQGLLVRRGHVLQTLARVRRVILDKTGTLTTGKLELQQVINHQGAASESNTALDGAAALNGAAALDSAAALDIAAALEQGCRHPIASAFNQRKTHKYAEQLDYQVGAGVSGSIDGERYALGKPAFVAEVLGLDSSALRSVDTSVGAAAVAGKHCINVVLANQGGVLAEFVLADAVRPGAQALVKRLTEQGFALELLSGDQEKNVRALANELGLKEWRANASPEDKLAHIRRRQGQGEVVLMVGDGINDIPVLSGADISLAMGEATDFTRQASDAVLLSGDLNTLVDAIAVAGKTESVIRQNIIWALIYNVSALPLAALGWVPPWAAALGMSASSLVVVLNALRLQRRGGGKLKTSKRKLPQSMPAIVEAGA
ncbi:MAG: heavy metal translocating P-type ATPase [Porticoccaceae bacterium]